SARGGDRRLRVAHGELHPRARRGTRVRTAGRPSAAAGALRRARLRRLALGAGRASRVPGDRAADARGAGGGGGRARPALRLDGAPPGAGRCPRPGEWIAAVNHDAAHARGGVWRPVGFLLLMLGFGLRLDTPWQALGGLLIFAGGLTAGAGV